MDKASNHLPFQMEIIDIDSSDGGSDIEVEADEPFDGSFYDSTNHDMLLHDEWHHSNGSTSYAARRHRPFTGISGESPGNNIEENGSGEICILSSDEAIHASKLKDHAIQNRSNGNTDANLVLYEDMVRDPEPERQILTDMLLGSVTIGQHTDAKSSQNSKRTLPSSWQPSKSKSVSPFNASFHGNASLSPQKNPMQAQKSKRTQAGPDDDNNSFIDANLNQHVHTQNHLPYVQMKNASTRLADEQSSQMHETAHGSVEAIVSSSNFDVEDVSEMNRDIYQKERRALPTHWIGKNSNNSQLNASLHSSIYGQNSNFSMKPSHPVSSKPHNTHMFPDGSLRNEKFTTTSKVLYGGIDDRFMYENASATRTLPQYPGKSNSNPLLPGSSDGGQFPGIGEQRLERDETLIYQEALQNLGQPKLEDDLPEGLLTVSLLKHQKVALAWMVQKERSVHCAGGILADDQGLGKTIAMIALILKQRDLQLKFTSDDSHHVKSEALNLDDDEGNNEMDVTGIRIGDHVKSEALNLDDYEGDNKMDVKGIGRNYLQSKLANTSENRRPAAGTLVVCPASVLRQWAHELEEKVSSSTNLSVLVYHGGTRTKDPKCLAKHDVILTTYSIVTNEVPKQPLIDDDDDIEQKDVEKYGLSSDFAARKKRKLTSNAGKKGKKKVKGLRYSHVDYGGPLARVRWFRVILDEAQTIKNHRTQVARACSALRAKRRWCLSGTPIQNAIDDLYSYFRFLKYDPYAVYSSFCSSIKYPISRNASQGYKKLQAILRVVLLRRTKATLINGEPIIKLPPKSISLKNVDFSPEERAFYMKLEADSRQQFKVYAAAGTVKQNYANILLMLLRLRQACDHPVLVKGFYSEANARDSLEMARQLPKEMLLNLLYQLEALAICPVCNDTPEDPVVTMCGHVFCYQCVSDRLTGDDNLCPATGCKDILGPDSVFSQATLKRCISDDLDVNAASSSSVHSEESSIVQSGFVSSKISAVVDILDSLSSQSYHAGKTEKSEDIWCSDKPVKAIVFSQWTGMLDLVEISLNRSLIQYRRLDGTMSLSSRDRSVREFNSDPEVTVMLMSLKAGNLGLNMVAACHVILLDLWWNPTTEDQAVDRAHRIGQTRPVTVSRLTIKDTVEDRILALQEDKRKLVSSAFGEDHTGNHTTKLTVEDLKYLFMI